MDGKIQDRLLVAVIDAGELGLLRLLLDHLQLFDHLRRKVLGCKLGIIQEKGLAVDGDLGNGLTVRGDRSILGHFHSRKLLQKVFEHVGVGCLEGRRGVLDRVFLDDDRIAGRSDFRSIEDFHVRVHLQSTEIQVSLHLDFLADGFVAHDLNLEHVLSESYAFNDGLAFGRAEHVLVRLVRIDFLERNSCKPDRVVI